MYSVWISTPCYGGQVLREFAKSMTGLYKLARRHNISVVFDSMENESLIPRGRNVAVGRFMNHPSAKNFTHFMFIDADIEFIPESVFRLLFAEHDVAVACYPKKYVNFEGARHEVANKGDRPLDMASADLVVNMGRDVTPIVRGFAKVMDGPTGFMMIRRNVIERMQDAYPKLLCKNDHANRDFEEYHALFDCMIEPETRRYLSEDYAFCRRWQALGGEIFADTQTVLGHVGNLTFRANISKRSGKITNASAAEPIQDYGHYEKGINRWALVVAENNHQISVRTLSILLSLCSREDNVDVIFTEDPGETMNRAIRTHNTVAFFNHGCSFDISKFVDLNWKDTHGALVIPSLRNRLDWKRFRETCLDDDGEPIDQKALIFDSVPGNPILPSKIHPVKQSDSNIIFLNCDRIRNKVKELPKKHINWVGHLKGKDIQVGILMDVDITSSVPHKCISGLGKSSAIKIEHGGSQGP